MAVTLPVTLTGRNLGERHRYFNKQVDQAAANTDSFKDIEAKDELTPVDRLFKIQLAIKLNNVKYILKNLKDDDMLYVSRALKCKWLLKRREIINPKYLEDVLFPEMVMPAISKMKHWLYTNLRDPVMCQDFYQYYKDDKFDFAVKFLTHCDNHFLLSEFPKIMIKITPHYLKVLGEKCPKLVKIYFDSLASDKKLVTRYMAEEKRFYNSIKGTLKLDSGMFLDITEKYNSLTALTRLSPSATDFILRHHKNRFLAKQEMYVMYLLHIPTIAKRLTDLECEEVILNLARSDFANIWFSYAAVEPLVKRIRRDKRAAFKQRVFIDRDVGERVTRWPYLCPSIPALARINDDSEHVFNDHEYELIRMHQVHIGKRFLKKRTFYDQISTIEGLKYTMIPGQRPVQTGLQKLFDEFRVVEFEGTLHELKVRISAASSADRRRDILLVLVSKSGGRAEYVKALLQLALKLRKEPVHERAAVVRSLTKRASSWRLPQDVWDMMLEYAYGLGLDGSKAEVECREGLHAVVMRQLLATGECEPAVRSAFLNNFSTLTEYKLTASERLRIAAALQRILVSAADNAEPEVAALNLDRLINVLENYDIPFESSNVVSTVAALAELNLKLAEPLLIHLYEAHVGRRELLRPNLAFRHNDAALVNVLRHDPDALRPQWLIKLLIDGETRGNQFFLKLSVYFNEVGGIAEHLRLALHDKIVQDPDVKLGRPLATLAGNGMETLWREQHVAGFADSSHFKLAAALRANMHRARPAPDAVALGWRNAGMKAVASRGMRCRPAQVADLVQTLFKERINRSVRLALALAPRTDRVVEIYSTAASIRPVAVLRAALSYFRRFGDAADLRIWDIIRPCILRIDLAHQERLRALLRKIEWVPKTIKADYCACLYLALNKCNDRNAEYLLYELVKYLPEVEEHMMETLLLQMLVNMCKESPESYPVIFIRYLLLSKNEMEQKTRYEKLAEPFLGKIYSFRDGKHEKARRMFRNNISQIISSLQYNYVFMDPKYECTSQVIEIFLRWLQKIMPRDMFFKRYVLIHCTMLYCKSIRQSIKRNPEVFDDPARKMTEGVEIVGFALGRYIARALAELRTQYFDSVVELYSNGFIEYLHQYFGYDASKFKLTAAILKGVLCENKGSEGRFAVQILRDCRNHLDDNEKSEIKELIMKSENKETHFFLHGLGLSVI